MDENRVKGVARDVAGKVQDGVGGLTGDGSLQARGKARQAAGQAQGVYGRVSDELSGFTTEQPIAAVLSAAGLGLVLGYLLSRI